VTGLLLIPAGILVLMAAGAAATGLGRVAKLGFPVLAWRFLSGAAHHGKPVTDAGWVRPGVKALTRTGHASRFHHRPRWQRAALRTGTVLAVLCAAYGLVMARHVTVLALGVSAAVLAGYGGVRAWRAGYRRKHRRTWIDPLHVALAPLVGVPLPNPPASWITVEPDRSAARLTLPPGFNDDARARERLVSVAAAKLGLEAPEVSWKLAGPEPMLTLTRSAPPPARVTYDDIADVISSAGPDELVVGVGKRDRIVKASLSLDSPHLAINMGTGGGKSSLAGFWLMQELRRGAIAMVLDSKWFSHPWLFKDEDGNWAPLPNVAYLSTPAQLHAGMMWLGAELSARNERARRMVDAAGRLRAPVGPRLFILAEELNFATPQLRQYWADIRESSDVKKSPALTAFGAVAFAGRAVRMHMILIGQMLTADVTGSKDSSVKENIGITAMARYGAPGWATAVGKNVPMPPSPSVLGRVQLVTASGVRETQTPVPDMLLYRRLAVSGTVTPLPAGMPGAARQVAAETGTPSVPPSLPSGPDQGIETVSGPAGLPPVSLSDAVRMGVVPMELAAVRTARHRDGNFPEPAGKRGLAHVYDPLKLRDWYDRRRAA
jgi:hypothetical protein